MIASLPLDEEGRLRTLRSLELLDTEPEPAFDALAAAARSIAGTEMALVSLVDAERQWFKSRNGLDVTETPREFSFCAHAILDEEPLCVEDATRDPRFRDNPYVVEEPQVRSYLGAPITVDGHNIGTVCAVSSARRRWRPEVRAAFEALSAAAAQQLEARRRMAFNERLLGSTSDAIVASDSEGRITYWNAAAEQILGWTAHEALGRPVTLIVPEHYRERHEIGFARLREGGHDSFGGRPVSVTALHKAGGEVPVELTLATWRGGAGVTVAAIVRDCTERWALAEARSANLAKDRFLATMSHEVRTPLNGLLGLAQVLARTPLTPEQQEIVDVMVGAGETLERLMTDVLDCADLQTGQLELAEEVFDLSAVLERVIRTHRPAADAKRLGLACSGPDAPVHLRADGSRLQQILDKLVGNAVKFTDHGAVRLIVRRPSPDEWRFEVTDTGAGFSPEAAAHIFEVFRPGDDTATRVHGGSGLGLALARQLAREMGGDLRAENRPEGGARLILTLPMPACDASSNACPVAA